MSTQIADRSAPVARSAARVTSADTDVSALVNAARAGRPEAWPRLIAHFERRLRGAVRPYRLAPCDVDDVLQSTWLLLFTHLDRIREPAAVGGWLITTARRECLRVLQTPVREQLTGDPERSDDRAQDGPEAALLAAESRAALKRALNTLPERHRRLMTLIASEEKPDYRQIGETLSMPVGSIGPIRARSLARLQRCPELRGVRPGAA